MLKILAFFGIIFAGGIGFMMLNASDAPHDAVSCTADSGKAFSPALNADEICTHFMRTIGAGAGEVNVELKFSTKGIASAKVSQLQDGKWKVFPLYELAVMDRGFNASDIDRLAHDVVRGITAAPQSGDKLK